MSLMSIVFGSPLDNYKKQKTSSEHRNRNKPLYLQGANSMTEGKMEEICIIQIQRPSRAGALRPISYWQSDNINFIFSV